MPVPVHHRRRTVGGVDVFYREARPPGVSPDAPVVLLPHGYPCSSYEFRDYMRHLGEHWRLLAPDFPGCGYSATPEDFDYDFDGFSRFLEDFVDALGVDRFALYLHDFGTWIGLRLALRHPDRIVALIVQNGDIYEDVLGPKYASLKEVWQMERAEGLAQLRPFVSREHFRDEFLNDVRPTVAERIPPDLWELHWTMMTEQRRENAARIIYDLKDKLVPALPGLVARAPAADPDPVGPAGRLHARGVGLRLAARPAAGGIPSAGRRTLAARNQPHGSGRSQPRLPGPGPSPAALGGVRTLALPGPPPSCLAPWPAPALLPLSSIALYPARQFPQSTDEQE